jgi:hypothetical protein
LVVDKDKDKEDHSTKRNFKKNFAHSQDTKEQQANIT